MALSYTLKLYQAAGSPNSRRVRIFRRINPRQVVPTLVLGDGTAIAEVPAIWRYLEEIYPAKRISA
jgi:glutathione S-transferase